MYDNIYTLEIRKDFLEPLEITDQKKKKNEMK